MGKLILTILLCFISALNIWAQDADKKLILGLLKEQEKEWNSGNLEKFMKPYWKSDSLMFIGKKGVTYGWGKTLENYQKSYPDTAAMGRLNFEIIEVKRLSVLYFHVTGKWKLTRIQDVLSGHFTLLFKRIGKEWVIVSDHSS